MVEPDDPAFDLDYDIPEEYSNEIVVGDYETTTFQAEVRGIVVNQNGQTEMKLLIPKEYKYDAVRVTDAPGKMWQFTASAPEAIGSYDDLAELLKGWTDD